MKILTNTPPQITNGRYYAEMYKSQVAILTPEAIYIYDVSNSAPTKNPIEGSVLVINNNIEFTTNTDNLKGLGNPLLYIGLIKTLLPLLVIGGGGFYLWNLIQGKIDDKKKGEGEQELDTNAGSIAQQLRTEFDKFGKIDAKKYESIMSQVKGDQDQVFTLYKKLTGRRLSDDIAEDINADTQTRVKKIQQWNANAYSPLNIINDKIIYLVAKGSYIRFTPGQKNGIPYYGSPSKITGAPLGILSPSTKMWKILDIKEVTVTGSQERSDFLKYLPYFFAIPIKLGVSTSKKYVMVNLDISSDPKKHYRIWVDVMNFITWKPHDIKGIEGLKNINELSLLL